MTLIELEEKCHQARALGHQNTDKVIVEDSNEFGVIEQREISFIAISHDNAVVIKI